MFYYYSEYKSIIVYDSPSHTECAKYEVIKEIKIDF